MALGGVSQSLDELDETSLPRDELDDVSVPEDEPDEVALLVHGVDVWESGRSEAVGARARVPAGGSTRRDAGMVAAAVVGRRKRLGGALQGVSTMTGGAEVGALLMRMGL